MASQKRVIDYQREGQALRRKEKKKDYRGLILFMIMTALAIGLFRPSCAHADFTVDQYFNYCVTNDHLAQKVFLHGGLSMVFGVGSELLLKDPLAAIPLALYPGVTWEAMQLIDKDEGPLSAVGDILVWDAPGAVLGVFGVDLIRSFDVHPIKNGAELTFNF